MVEHYQIVGVLLVEQYVLHRALQNINEQYTMDGSVPMELRIVQLLAHLYGHWKVVYCVARKSNFSASSDVCV